MKFLYEDPRTTQLLDKTGQGKAILVAHFFYLMGSPMQCNIKGLLCTLLYQLLQRDTDGRRLIKLFREFPATRHKESYTNWSERELRKCLLWTLKQLITTQSVCIFLDGLDEIHGSDGAHNLLRLLDCLRATGSIRLCLSSQPEQVFKQAFREAPSLELHHLTVADMYLFARDLLRPLAKCIASDVPRTPDYTYGFNHVQYPSGHHFLAKAVADKSSCGHIYQSTAFSEGLPTVTHGLC